MWSVSKTKHKKYIHNVRNSRLTVARCRPFFQMSNRWTNDEKMCVVVKLTNSISFTLSLYYFQSVFSANIFQAFFENSIFPLHFEYLCIFTFTCLHKLFKSNIQTSYAYKQNRCNTE